MSKKSSDTSGGEQLSALLELMQDDNVKVASLAMERFLKLGSKAEDMVAYYQEEAASPQLRHRMHQLSGILARRKVRASFLEALRTENVDIWEGIMQVNRLFNPECDEFELEEVIREFAAGLEGREPNTARFAAFFRDQGFAVAEEDTLDSELYLPEAVLVNRCGAPVLLCALAQHVGKLKNWTGTIALHE